MVLGVVGSSPIFHPEGLLRGRPFLLPNGFRDIRSQQAYQPIRSTSHRPISPFSTQSSRPAGHRLPSSPRPFLLNFFSYTIPLPARTPVRTSDSTLEPNNVLYLSDYQIIHSIFFVVWYRKVPTKSNWFTKWIWHKTANKERICSCNWCFAHFFVASCNI